MKRVFAIMMGVVLLLSLVSGVALAKNPEKGNGAPSGAHYNLNIIGVPNEKNDNFDGGNGSRIFVSRTGTTKFWVYGGDSYAILDHDGTDGFVGTGMGPDDAGIIFPYSEDVWQVEIYVRLVGPKDSSIHWKSEYFDGSEWLLIDEFDLAKSSKFSLKTGSLLKDGYQDALWTLNPTNKFRNLQMRIYLK